MSENSAIHALPYIQPSQAQKHVTHNEALRLLDVMVQLSVMGLQASPPATPQTGDRYIVAASAQAAWAGHETALALWDGVDWQFYLPQQGWRAGRQDSDALWVFDGIDWGGYGTFDGPVPQLGINTSADAVNRLAVAAEATLLTHAGAGHQVKINKAGAGDTTSLLFQTGFSGRAEMGTAGSDDFSIKVSADGSAWATALSVDAASGAPDLAPGASIDGQGAYHRGNLVGSVSQSAGQPTGAVIEQGSTAQGDYLRLADGTQICWGAITTATGGAVSWTYPVAFAGAAHVTGVMDVDAPEFLTSFGGDGTGVDISGWSQDGSRVASPAQLMAVGRWY